MASPSSVEREFNILVDKATIHTRQSPVPRLMGVPILGTIGDRPTAEENAERGVEIRMLRHRVTRFTGFDKDDRWP